MRDETLPHVWFNDEIANCLSPINRFYSKFNRKFEVPSDKIKYIQSIWKTKRNSLSLWVKTIRFHFLHFIRRVLHLMYSSQPLFVFMGVAVCFIMSPPTPSVQIVMWFLFHNHKKVLMVVVCVEQRKVQLYNLKNGSNKISTDLLFRWTQ